MDRVNTASATAFSEPQRLALLTLLADEDPAVYRSIRATLIASGPEGVSWLRDLELHANPVLRRRAEDIALHFERQDADNRFIAFCLNHGQEFDLEKGLLLLARTAYPRINAEGYSAVLDYFAAVLGDRLRAGGQKPRQLLSVFNKFFFQELGFVGNERDFYAAENSYLNKVLDQRTGNPISLCLIYLLIARRLSLPVTGIGFPGHFLCRFQSSESELYIDVFNRGKLLAKADCIQHLLQGHFGLKEQHLAPVSPRGILLRMCGNLHQVYQQAQNEADATRIQRYLVALAK